MAVSNPFGTPVARGLYSNAGVQTSSSEFSRGIKRGVKQAEADLFAAAQVFGELTGIDPIAKWGKEGWQRKLKEAQAYAPRVQTFDQVKGPSDLADYVAGAVGEQVPNLGLLATGAGAGGLAGRALTNKLLRLSAKELIKEHGAAGARKLLEDRAKRLVTNASRAGAFGTSYGLNTGETQIELQQAGLDRPGVAALAGVPIAGLDVAGLETIIRRAFPRTLPTEMAKGLTDQVARHIFKRMGIGAATGAGVEIPTEVAQEIIQIAAQAAADPSKSLDELLAQSGPRLREVAIRSGIVGGALGGVAGGAGGLLETQQNNNLQTPPAQTPSEPAEAPIAQPQPQVLPEARSQPVAAPEQPSPSPQPPEATVPSTAAPSQPQEAALIPGEQVPEALSPSASSERQTEPVVVRPTRPSTVDALRLAVPGSEGRRPSRKTSAGQAQGLEVLLPPSDEVTRPVAQQLAKVFDAGEHNLSGRLEITHPQAEQKHFRISLPELARFGLLLDGENIPKRQLTAREILHGVTAGALWLKDRGFKIPKITEKTSFDRTRRWGDILNAARQETGPTSGPGLQTPEERLQQLQDTERRLIDQLEALRAPLRGVSTEKLRRQARKLALGQLIERAPQDLRTAFEELRKNSNALPAKQLIERELAARPNDQQLRQLAEQLKAPSEGATQDLVLPKGKAHKALTSFLFRQLQTELPDLHQRAQRFVLSASPEKLDAYIRRRRAELLSRDLERTQQEIQRIEDSLAAQSELSPQREQSYLASQTATSETEEKQAARSARDVLPEKKQQTVAKRPQPTEPIAKRFQTYLRSDKFKALSKSITPAERGYVQDMAKLLKLPEPHVVDQFGVEDLIKRFRQLRAKYNVPGAEKAVEQLEQLKRDKPVARVLYMQHFKDPNLRVPIIYISARAKRSKRRANILTHELGHIVLRQHLQAAPLEVRRALIEELGDGPDFDERFANALRYWAASREEPRSVLERWFKTVADALRKLWLWLRRRSGGDARFKRFDAFMNWLISPSPDEFAKTLSSVELTKGTGLGRTELPHPTRMVYMPYDPALPPTNDFTRIINLGKRKQFQERFAQLGKWSGQAVKTVWGATLASNDAWLRAYGLGWLADHFHKRPGEVMRRTPVPQEIRMRMGRYNTWIDRLGDALKDPALADYLIYQKDRQKVKAPNPKAVEEIDKFFDELIHVLRSAGVNVRKRKNYFPLLFNINKIQANREQFEDVVKELFIERIREQRPQESQEQVEQQAENLAKELYSKLVENGGFDAPELYDDLLVGPAFVHAKRRQFSREREIRKLRDWLIDEPALVMQIYAQRAIRRSTLQKRFGLGPGEATTPVPDQQAAKAYLQSLGVKLDDDSLRDLWTQAAAAATSDQYAKGQVQRQHLLLVTLQHLGLNTDELRQPLVKLHIRLKAMYRDGAFGPDSDNVYQQLMQRVLPALLGRLDLSKGQYWQHVAEGAILYENARLLAGASLASLPDFGLAVMRTESVARAWKALRSVLNKQRREELRKIGQELGILSQKVTDHYLNDDSVADGVYLFGHLQRWNERLFKLIGLHHWTEFVRLFAMEAGRLYIADMLKQKNEAKLKELGLSLDPKDWTRENFWRALDTFVDESVIRVTNPKRAWWMASKHPMLRILAHLKGFIWGFHETALRYVIARSRQYPHVLKAWPFVMMGLYLLPLAMVGYEIRKLIFGKPKSAPEDELGYVGELMNRAGVYGIYQLFVDVYHGAEYGKGILALPGPTISHLNDVMSTLAGGLSWQKLFAESVPIAAASPAARDWIAEQLGYEPI